MAALGVCGSDGQVAFGCSGLAAMSPVPVDVCWTCDVGHGQWAQSTSVSHRNLRGRRQPLNTFQLCAYSVSVTFYFCWAVSVE